MASPPVVKEEIKLPPFKIEVQDSIPPVAPDVELKKLPLSRFRSLDQIITDNFCLIATTYEGRDKLVKFLQYLAKYMSWHSNRNCESEVGQLYYQISSKLAI